MVTTEVGDQEYIDTGYTEWGASGLAAVWAENNTRESIYDAFQTKGNFCNNWKSNKGKIFWWLSNRRSF